MQSKIVALVTGIMVMGTTPVFGADVLTGDTALACEAILCLSSGTQPPECAPSLNRYFGIHHKKLKDTLNARRAFLNQCPTVSEAGMTNLVNTLVNGAGRCTAAALNSTLAYRVRDYANEVWITRIDDELPSYCTSYSNHAWTDGVVSVEYIGTPSTGGRWVDK